MALDFTKLTAKEIKEYMSVHATDKQKKDFIAEAFTMQKEKVAVEVKDANGNPIMYQLSDKEGKPKFDAEGNPIMRKKLEYVEKQNGTEKKVFSLLKAKWWFAENFADAVTNVPKRASKAEKAGDLFADWF